MWGGWDIEDSGNTDFTALLMYGGSGHDAIFGGKNNAGVTKIWGEGGSDKIRTDWYANDFAKNDQYIWGDFEYDAENPDDEIWGEADVILAGDSQNQ